MKSLPFVGRILPERHTAAKEYNEHERE